MGRWVKPKKRIQQLCQIAMGTCRTAALPALEAGIVIGQLKIPQLPEALLQQGHRLHGAALFLQLKELCGGGILPLGHESPGPQQPPAGSGVVLRRGKKSFKRVVLK